MPNVNYEKSHNIILENRNKLSISGVEDVESFDEKEISLYTSQGRLLITGDDLKVDKLSVEEGELTVSGRLDSFEYSGDNDRRSFLSKLFG